MYLTLNIGTRPANASNPKPWIYRTAKWACANTRAFTLVELFVTLAVLALVTVVSVPVISRSQPVSRTFQCLNNNRQLCNAWRMYADDNRDRIVYASDDGSTTGNPLNQYAWTQGHLDFSPANRYNWDASTLTNSPLWTYCGGNFAIFKCPSDRTALLVSGVYRPRVRTMAMNLYLGGFAGTTGGWPFATPYRIFLKTTELSAPGPSKTFVLLDMRPDFVSWGNFLTDMSGYPNDPSRYTLQDFPGYFHDGGCSFSFGDSHVELHRWADTRTVPPPNLALSSPFTCPSNPDVAWLQNRATAPK